MTQHPGAAGDDDGDESQLPPAERFDSFRALLS
jgi:hypothetical protein